jgi:peptidyl-dipeptidase A
VRRTEAFYRSIGFPELPASYYERSQFIKPADRDVLCHASAGTSNLEATCA